MTANSTRLSSECTSSVPEESRTKCFPFREGTAAAPPGLIKSKEVNPATLTPSAKASVFTIVTPTLTPVNDPGPTSATYKSTEVRISSNNRITAPLARIGALSVRETKTRSSSKIATVTIGELVEIKAHFTTKPPPPPHPFHHPKKKKAAPKHSAQPRPAPATQPKSHKSPNNPEAPNLPPAPHSPTDTNPHGKPAVPSQTPGSN